MCRLLAVREANGIALQTSCFTNWNERKGEKADWA